MCMEVRLWVGGGAGQYLAGGVWSREGKPGPPCTTVLTDRKWLAGVMCGGVSWSSLTKET